MGGSSGSGGSKSVPQPAAQVPQAPSYGAQLSDYISNYPKMYALEQEYGPKEAQLTLDLLKQYGPQYDQYLKEQQDAINPVTAGLQENLAKIAQDNMGGGLPDYLKNQYLDTLRSELGSNVGSGIGADYVSRNLASLGEQYRNNYQNLALSLINRTPVQSAMSNVPYANPTSGFGNSLNYGASTYGNYVQGLTSMPYYTNGGSSAGSTAGMLGAMLGGNLLGSFGGSGTGSFGAGTNTGYGVGGRYF